MKGLKGISLTSTGRSNGARYTEEEKALALSISKAVLTATGLRNYSDAESDQMVLTALEDSVREQKYDSVPAYCRAIYKKVEEVQLKDDSTLTSFPKVNKEGQRSPRDWTSVGLLFRHAFIECGFSEEELKDIFPKYSPKKSVS